MRRIGFSTGALAKGDFRQGIGILRQQSVDAIELSALREHELDELLKALPDLDLDGFSYVSFHAPSRLESLGETELVKRLQTVASHVHAIVVHPDIIKTPTLWRPIEESIVIENMDQRKPIGRTTAELHYYFSELPNSRFCFDIGHARQVDPTLSGAVDMLQTYSDRLAEIHISEVDAASRHVAISCAAKNSYQRIASLLPESVPAIVESIVAADNVGLELDVARSSLSNFTPRKLENKAQCVNSR